MHNGSVGHWSESFIFSDAPEIIAKRQEIDATFIPIIGNKEAETQILFELFHGTPPAWPAFERDKAALSEDEAPIWWIDLPVPDIDPDISPEDLANAAISDIYSMEHLRSIAYSLNIKAKSKLQIIKKLRERLSYEDFQALQGDAVPKLLESHAKKQAMVFFEILGHTLAMFEYTLRHLVQYVVAEIRTIQWSTGACCDACENVDDLVIPLGARFPGVNVLAPPAHVGCSCATIPADEDLGDWGGTPEHRARAKRGGYTAEEYEAKFGHKHWIDLKKDKKADAP